MKFDSWEDQESCLSRQPLPASARGHGVHRSGISVICGASCNRLRHTSAGRGSCTMTTHPPVPPSQCSVLQTSPTHPNLHISFHAGLLRPRRTFNRIQQQVLFQQRQDSWSKCMWVPKGGTTMVPSSDALTYPFYQKFMLYNNNKFFFLLRVNASEA
jgi:hypothetical protein